MPTIVALLLTVAVQEDEPVNLPVRDSTWARTLSATGRRVRARDVRAAGCVSYDQRGLVCSWEQCLPGGWRRFSVPAGIAADGGWHVDGVPDALEWLDPD